MKKLNKKGFTIVELVIVIAVIAILAAVLIPTFSGVVDKANQSAALQEARNNMTNDLVEAESDYANMLDYTLDSKQYYVVSSISVKKEAKLSEAAGYVSTNTYYTVASKALTKVEDAAVAATADTTYYVVAEYNGVYTANTSATAKDAKWVDVVGDYTCTYTISTGEWTVAKTAN